MANAELPRSRETRLKENTKSRPSFRAAEPVTDFYIFLHMTTDASCHIMFYGLRTVSMFRNQGTPTWSRGRQSPSSAGVLTGLSSCTISQG